MSLLLRSFGNLGEDPSDEEIEELLDLPLFLAYIASFFFHLFKKDGKAIKFAVWFAFVLEWTSTIIATIAALMSIMQYVLSDLASFPLFKARSPLCGLVILVVQSSYSYRIWTLGRRLTIPVIILLLSVMRDGHYIGYYDTML
ncbi:hypothetical protein L218DRAFT_484236 [Marasmius fiardii PR-910]|nr:hypothetical protein L218DRAFT_484236 [Marasmius fiardii PR-910]